MDDRLERKASAAALTAGSSAWLSWVSSTSTLSTTLSSPCCTPAAVPFMAACMLSQP